MTIHQGGCHCARVRFKVEASANLKLSECNCSMCSMSGYWHLIVPKESFSLTSGENDLSTYTFNTGTALHYFCRHCGVKSFYVPRSHPDGISINARCIDPGTVESITIEPFDGRDWSKNADQLRELDN